MAKIIWTDEAHGWLREIYDYIATDNPDAALAVIRGIYAKAQILRRFPEVGYKYKDVSEGEIRILLYGHYRITYLTLSATDQIIILGVFHGAMDIDRYQL